MTLQAWLRQFEDYSEEMLQKEVFIEARNGLLFAPEVKIKWKHQWGTLNYTNEVESFVISY